MSITKQDIEKLSNLAKLDLNLDANNFEFTDKLINNLNNILQLVEQLQSVDTTNIEPMVHSEEHAEQRLRPDIIAEHNVRDLMQGIAPTNSTESGLYLVPKVIDH
jgi:aspartyl-tRNA(Asn)/glutamyl-tRNA(Gln) amidotransferase subunit C